MSNELSKDWIIGFYEGEGGIYASKPRGKICGFKFSIIQNEKETLEKIGEALPTNEYSIGRRSKGSHELWVGKRQAITKIISWLDGELRTEKKQKQLDRVKEELEKYKKTPGAKSEYWLKAETEYLEKYWKDYLDKALGKQLGRTERAVREKRHRLNLIKTEKGRAPKKPTEQNPPPFRKNV